MGNLPLKSCNPFNMAGLFQAFLGGSKPSASPIPAGDNDFADFAGAPEPTPAAYSAASSPVSFMGASAAPTGAAVPYTKWYNIHERHSLSDFKQEGVILAMIAVIVTVHMLGTSANRRKAKAWITAHATVLQKEFALVGFGGRKAPTLDLRNWSTKCGFCRYQLDPVQALQPTHHDFRIHLQFILREPGHTRREDGGCPLPLRWT